MAYRIRSARRLSRKTRHSFLATIIIIIILLFVTINWLLPGLINGIGFVKNFTRPSQAQKNSLSENPSLAPPVLNIPFEATNSAQIDIKGYATANSKVKLYLDDSPKQTAEVNSDGSFIIENVSLSLGINNIYAKTLNDKDNESLPSKAFRITYDNEKPILDISEPEDGKKIQGGDKKIKVSGKTEAGAKILINDSQVVVDKEGNFTTELPISDGDNMITIKAIDSAANTTEVQKRVNYTP